MLTQNIGKKGHASFCGTGRGYCMADAMYFLYLHEVLSKAVKEVLQRIDAAMSEGGVSRFSPPCVQDMVLSASSLHFFSEACLLDPWATEAAFCKIPFVGKNRKPLHSHIFVGSWVVIKTKGTLNC